MPAPDAPPSRTFDHYVVVDPVQAHGRYTDRRLAEAVAAGSDDAVAVVGRTFHFDQQVEVRAFGGVRRATVTGFGRTRVRVRGVLDGETWQRWINALHVARVGTRDVLPDRTTAGWASNTAAPGSRQDIALAAELARLRRVADAAAALCRTCDPACPAEDVTVQGALVEQLAGALAEPADEDQVVGDLIAGRAQHPVRRRPGPPGRPRGPGPEIGDPDMTAGRRARPRPGPRNREKSDPATTLLLF